MITYIERDQRCTNMIHTQLIELKISQKYYNAMYYDENKKRDAVK